MSYRFSGDDISKINYLYYLENAINFKNHTLGYPDNTEEIRKSISAEINEAKEQQNNIIKELKSKTPDDVHWWLDKQFSILQQLSNLDNQKTPPTFSLEFKPDKTDEELYLDSFPFNPDIFSDDHAGGKKRKSRRNKRRSRRNMRNKRKSRRNKKSRK